MSRNMNFQIQFHGNGKKKSDVYPTKRTMNLYYKEDRTTLPATIALYVLFVIVVLIGLLKVMVYDPMVRAGELKENYNNIQDQITQYQTELSDYKEIENQYFLYSATEEEQNQVDRMEIIGLIDSVVRPQADIQNIEIKDGVVLVQFSGLTLSQTAEIVEKMEEASFIENIQVDTASTTATNSNIVDADVYIDLVGDDADEEEQ